MTDIRLTQGMWGVPHTKQPILHINLDRHTNKWPAAPRANKGGYSPNARNEGQDLYEHSGDVFGRGFDAK